MGPGQQGAVYLFDASTGQQLHKITAPGSGTSDFFGWSVDIDDGMLAVGAYNAAGGLGRVYLYDVETATLLQTLVHESLVTSVGYDVAIDDGLVVAGARFDSVQGSAAVAVVVFDAETGEELAVLYASDGESGDQLGHAVAFADGVIVGGAPNDDDLGSGKGAAYLFGGEPEDPCENDIDGSGVVDLADLLSVLAAFGAPCD